MDLNNTNSEKYLMDVVDEPKNELNQNTLWYVFSLLSWFLLVCCQIESYLSDSNSFYKNSGLTPYGYIPILKIFILLFSISGLIIYLIFTTCKKDQNLYNGMLGGNAKFHFVFFLFASALFIIDQLMKFGYFDDYRYDEYDDYYESDFYKKLTKKLMIADFIFSIFGIITLLFSYTQIKLACEWYIVLPIKKGTFSCFIPYLIFKICLDLINFIIERDYDISTNLYKAIVILYFILIGLISLGLSFIFKDIIMAFTNGLIYIAYIINYSSSVENTEERLTGCVVFEGIIIVGSSLASFILIGILVLIHKEKIFK